MIFFIFKFHKKLKLKVNINPVKVNTLTFGDLMSNKPLCDQYLFTVQHIKSSLYSGSCKNPIKDYKSLSTGQT